MAAFINLAGQRFGRLVVTTRAPNKGKKVNWNYICDCGKTGVAFTTDLRSGRHQSCGCLHREIVTKHGDYMTKEYHAWINMINRCTYSSYPDWKHYGGRGINVCREWRNSYEYFLEDVGRAPSTEHSLDRIDVNGNYEPSNVRWATRSEQRRNRRPEFK